MITIRANGRENSLPYEGQNISYQTMLDEAAAAPLESAEAVYEEITNPQSMEEVSRHSWKGLLAEHVGQEVLVTFLIGTQNTVTVRGELEEVGNDFISIYRRDSDSHVSCDLYSVKFAEMYGDNGQTV